MVRCTICLRDGLSRRVVVGTCHCKAAVLVCKSLICDRVSIPPVTGGRWQVKKFTHVLEHGSCIASDPGWTQVHTIGCSHSNPVIQRDRLGTGRRKPVGVSTLDLERARYWQVHDLTGEAVRRPSDCSVPCSQARRAGSEAACCTRVGIEWRHLQEDDSEYAIARAEPRADDGIQRLPIRCGMCSGFSAVPRPGTDEELRVEEPNVTLEDSAEPGFVNPQPSRAAGNTYTSPRSI